MIRSVGIGRAFAEVYVRDEAGVADPGLVGEAQTKAKR